MMQFSTIAGRRYAQFQMLRQEAGLVHAFSTRPDNLSARPGPRQAERAARRRQVALDLGLTPERIRHCEQVHEHRVALVDGDRSAGQLDGVDAVVTAKLGVPLLTFSADCPLILLYDAGRRVLGLVHASWRCTVGELSRRVVELMQREFGCEPCELRAGIGPGAGPCCYEVRGDVYEAAAGLAARDSLFEQRDERLYFDLWQANHRQLCGAGLVADRIEIAGVCTMCRNDVFYSFRREGSGCGHFGLMAALIDG